MSSELGASQLGAVRYYLARGKGFGVAEPSESPWYRDPTRQAAIVTTVVTLLVLLSQLVFGMFNGRAGVAADDVRAAVTPIVTGVVAVLAILAARRRAFAPKTVADGDPAVLKSTASVWR